MTYKLGKSQRDFLYKKKEENHSICYTRIDSGSKIGLLPHKFVCRTFRYIILIYITTYIQPFWIFANFFSLYITFVCSTKLLIYLCD